jgi:hypothetical protein
MLALEAEQRKAGWTESEVVEKVRWKCWEKR